MKPFDYSKLSSYTNQYTKQRFTTAQTIWFLSRRIDFNLEGNTDYLVKDHY